MSFSSKAVHKTFFVSVYIPAADHGAHRGDCAVPQLVTKRLFYWRAAFQSSPATKTYHTAAFGSGGVWSSGLRVLCSCRAGPAGRGGAGRRATRLQQRSHSIAIRSSSSSARSAPPFVVLLLVLSRPLPPPRWNEPHLRNALLPETSRMLGCPY